MNHQETHQTNPMAPWDPLDVSLNPLGPPAAPNRYMPEELCQVSPNRTLIFFVFDVYLGVVLRC